MAPAMLEDAKRADAEIAFVAARWPDGLACPYCASHHVSTLRGRKGWLCLDCHERFTATSGTVIASTHATQWQWYCVLWLVAEHGITVSTGYLAQSVGVTQPTAWYMRERIIYALNRQEEDDARHVGDTA